jgi:endonuclease VIII
MPEGPSIVIAKEALRSLQGKKIIEASGNAKIDLNRIFNQKVTDLKSWGKHFLICFPGFFLRIHFMMFGTYRLNERKETKPRLQLAFKGGEANFYACSIRLVDGSPDEHYDWQSDVMSDQWNTSKAKKALSGLNAANVCDVLLDQEIFSGVGNIIKNEVLFRTRVHPESVIGALSTKKLNELIRESRQYSFDFYEWKKINQFKKHWLIYKKKECPRCNISVIREYMGKGMRLTCFCSNCQVLYK